MRLLALAAASLCLSGCSLMPWVGTPRFDPKTREAVQARVAGRRFLVLVYEGVPVKSGRRESRFRFDTSDLLDKVFVELRYPVLERATVQKLIEAEPLPDSGSFSRETLSRMAGSSGADVLVLGYEFSEDQTSMIGLSSKRWKVILRAIDLRSAEVINSVQSADVSDSGFRSLAALLVYKTDLAQY